MIEGMFKAAFSTALGHGNGIVVLRSGTIEGGDSVVYYTGTYSQIGEDFSADLHTTTYAPANGRNLFGTAKASTTVKGKVNGEIITGSGSIGGFKVTLTRIQP
jgi:hypothetical protein